MDDTTDEVDTSELPEPQHSVPEGEAEVATKTRKSGKRSFVWDHFKPITEENDPNPRAACLYCDQAYACHSVRNGTTAMKTHLVHHCKVYPLSKHNTDKKQKTLGFEPIAAGDDGVVGKLTAVSFSVEACVKALAQMIILDELPFRFVEGESFKRFMRVAQPKWLRIPYRVTIARECMNLYQQEKIKLKRALKGQRVCLTTDTWTSLQSLNYMCLTAHFIDCDWNLHKKIINFCVVTNHKGETLGKEVESCLVEWGIDNILTIKVDNASSNNGLINYVKRKTKERKSTILEHKYLHIRCCAHILNLIVSDGLKDVHTSIARVRNVTKYVKSSPSRLATFRRYVDKEGIDSKLVPCLDVPTRWNSTYFMLERALVYRKAFERLEEENTLLSLSVKDDELGNVNDLNENGVVEDSGRGKVSKKTYGTPTSDDWEIIKLYVEVLKLFFDATERFSGSLYVICNSFFVDMMLIRKEIVKLSDSPQDPVLKALACAMKNKFEKYWKFEKVNALLLYGLILDPRYKFKYVEWCLKQWYEKDVIEEMVKAVKKDMCCLYSWYENNGCDAIQAQEVGQSSNKRRMVEELSMNSLERMKHEFKMHLEEEDSLVSKSELERYWMESCEFDNEKFSILGWWKLNSAKYPVLSKIARDILTIPVSTVASESAFSVGGRILDPYRTSLSPKTAEALICTQDWLRSPTEIRLRDYMNEVERLEAELENASEESIASNVD